MYNTMEFLSTPLPGEVSSLIYAGLIDDALERIELVLQRTNDPQLIKRLKFEKITLPILVEAYPYTKGEALTLIRKELPEFVESKFREWEHAGMIEYILYDGERHYFNRFWETLKAVYPSVAALVGEPTAQTIASKQHLSQTIQSIIQNKKGSCHYKMHAEIKINDHFFIPGCHVLVHLPFPKPVYPMKNIHLTASSHSDYILAPEDAPSRTISFEKNLMEPETFWVEYEYDCEILYHNLWEESTSFSASAPLFFETEECLPHIRFTPYLKQLTASIIGKETNLLKKAQLIYNFCVSNITYSYMPPYIVLRDIAETCAICHKGDCGVQALLFITLCRIAKIPARFQSGLSAREGSTAGCHDWAEIYLNSYGWLPVDLSFGSKAWREKDEMRTKFYFGNLDPFRMVANTAFQSEFIPPKQGLRSDPYDNQKGEIEVNGIGLLGEEFDAETYILERISNISF